MERFRLKIEPVEKKKRPAMPGAGRPTSYRPEYAKIAGELAARGATDDQLGAAFGKSTDTIQQWRLAHPEFAMAIARGKNDIFDPLVERSLAQRALGYTVDTEEVKIMSDGSEVRYAVRKHFPPDTTACIFWLKNRKPQQWRDVHKLEHSGKLETDNLTAAELLAEIRKEAAELGIMPEIAGKLLGVAPNGKGNGGTKH